MDVPRVDCPRPPCGWTKPYFVKKMKCLQKHVCHVQLSEALGTTGTMGHSTVNFSKKQWRIYIVKFWTRNPLGPIFSFDALFRKIWLNIRLLPSLWGWRPLGNP